MTNPRTYLFVTVDGGGNIPPVMGVANTLLERGHRVTFLSEPCMKSAVEATGASFLPFQKYFTRANSGVDLFEDTTSTKGDMATMENVVLGPSKVTFEETQRAIEAVQPDVLVVDVLLPAALIAAELRGIPRVVLFHMPEYLPGPNRPPGMLGLKPGRGMLGRWRDRLLGKVWNKKLNAYLPQVNAIRSDHGLPLLDNAIDLLHQADMRLILTLPAFDFPIVPAPVNVRYTGPVIDDPYWAGEWENPWPDEQRPLVVIGMSSTFMNQAVAIQRCIEALGELPVRGLVTTGPALDPAQFDAPENVKVLRAVPHSAVFPQASAVITHAGHGTVIRALAKGVPLVCMPVGRDQKDNAVKVVHHGCGVKLRANAKAGAIGTAVKEVLDNPKYREQAREWKRLIGQPKGAERAVDYLMQLNVREVRGVISD